MTTPKPPTGSAQSDRPQVISKSIPASNIEEYLGDLDFDPDDVLASLVPYDEPGTVAESESPPLVLTDEQPAHCYAQELNLDEQLLGIANRLSTECTEATDPAQRSELAFVSSEILAIVGDANAAQSFARRASEAAPSSRLALIQARHLAIDSGDIADVQSLIAQEISALPDASSKLHLHLWYSEFLRTILLDKAASDQALSQASAESPSDGQVSLLQLLCALADGGPSYLQCLASYPSLLPLADAIRTLARLRGDLSDPDSALEHPAAVALDVAQLLSEADLSGAAHRLSKLISVPGCERPIRWLRACFMAASMESRQDSIAELLELEQLDTDPEVRCALLERAVEQGDNLLTRRLLQDVESNIATSASAVDDLILSVLASASPELVRELCEKVAGIETFAPLATAAMRLADPNSDESPGAENQTRFELAMARWISRASPSVGFSLPPAAPLEQESDDIGALSYAFELEEARARLDWSGVARLIQFASDSSGPWLSGDRETLAALLYEAGGEEQLAHHAWQQVRTARNSREVAIRAILEGSANDEKRSILEETAESLDVQDERAPYLMLEAAMLAMGSEQTDIQRLLEHAHAISPDLILPMTMGEDFARNMGNTEAALDWLSKRSESTDDAVESALIAAQEAIILMSKDAMSAELSVLRAIEYIPTDTTLHELRNHLAPASSLTESQSQATDELPDQQKLEILCQHAARAAWFGDWRVANDTAIRLAQAEAPTVGILWAEQAAIGGNHYPKLFEKLFSLARAESDPVVQREYYERLARIDPNAGQEGSVDLWQNAIIERTPGHLPALRGLERSIVRRGRWLDLASISEKLMQELDRNEALGYSWLTSTLHTYAGNWATGERFVDWAARQEPAPLWSLRRQLTHALAKSDWATAHAIECRLAERASYAGDATALTVRSAESAARLEQWDTAFARLKSALDLTPDHVVALSLWASWQLQRGDSAASADGFEQLAQACADRSHREAALSRAAELWLSVGDESRAEFAFEQLLSINPHNIAALARLSELYKSSSSHDRLAALLERQLEHTQDPVERTGLHVQRARCLLALGLTIAADKALEPALHAFPDDTSALEVKAEIALAVDDLLEAEFTYTRLLKIETDTTKQAQLYRKLGLLYERSEGKLDAAQSAFHRLLEILPADPDALSALVRLSLARGDTAEAIRLQNLLVDAAIESLDQRQRLIELARIYESAALDRRRAEEILEKARRKWQNDSVILRALAEFYQRVADGAALQVLLDRSATEARRALHTGRFEIAFFEVLATVASLRDQPDYAHVAGAVVSALQGTPTALPGVGPPSESSRFDEILAPEVLNLPLRAMLQRTGWVLDAALPVDLSALQVAALADVNSGLYEHTQDLANRFDLVGLMIWVSNVIGQTCIPVQSRPPVLVLGQPLLESKNALVRDFLLIRAMKALQTHTACLARAAPVDLWPLLAAYLGLFLPNWLPTGVDTKRIEDNKQNMLGVLANAYTHDMAALAQDVVLALGNRASQLGEAVNEWGSRTALLALGDPSVALDALALTTGSGPLPADSAVERVKWVIRHTEARNVAIFSVSEAYMQLRAQLLRV